MKQMKQKHWQVSVFDKTSEIIKDDTFYTTDTEAYLVFELIDEDFTPDSAMITVYNIYGTALINVSVEVADGIVSYEMPEKAIRHRGGWRTQAIFTKDGEDYTTAIIEFDVGGHLLDSKKPPIIEIENWNIFIAHAGELIDDWEQLEEIRQANEQQRELAESARQNEFETNESTRQSEFETNETSRQTNELVREEAENNRQSTFETNETKRQTEFETNETERESAFEINESGRQANELIREEAEGNRQSTFEENELARESAESVRVANEEERISKDSERDSKIEAVEEELNQHKLDCNSQRRQDQLKVASIEKDLHDYQSTMASVNVNQEAKQTASGYGVVSLPKNTANGQVNVSLKGNTETDEEGSTKSTVSASRLKSVGKNLLSLKSKKILDNLPYTSSSQSQQYFRDYDIIIGVTRNGYITSGNVEIYELTENKLDIMTKNSAYGVGIKFKAQAGETYTRDGNVHGVGLFDKDGNNLDFSTTSNKSIIAPPDTAFGFAVISTEPNVRQAIENFQVERGSAATDYEPYRESNVYITAKNEAGNILELRSLPNGVKDEIRVSGGKAEKVQRVSDEVVFNGVEGWLIRNDILLTNCAIFLGSSLSNALPNGVCNSDRFVYNSSTHLDEEHIRMAANQPSIYILKSKLEGWSDSWTNAQKIDALKTWLSNNPVTLTYQLAEPNVTPIEVSGTLLSNPSGTVYVENAVADAGVYNDGINVLHQDLPIDYVEKLSKVDFTTGLETELDVSKAVVNVDNSSFTHPDLMDGDIVFFTYFHSVEGTQGEVELEYYDSRHVLKDSVTGKFYKIVQTVTDGVLTDTLVEV